MSDVSEDEVIEPQTDGATLLYDYFKHLTSLCVLSLGGVLALVPNAKGVKPLLIIAVLAVLGLAALFSFVGTSEVVRSRFLQQPLNKGVNSCRVAAPMLLSIGVGMFIYIFTRTLK